MMFTKKNPHKMGCCLDLNDHQARRTIPSHHEKFAKKNCAAHQHSCQQLSSTCYRSMRCSQNSDNPNFSNQEFEENLYEEPHANPCHATRVQNVQVQRKPVICDNVLVKRRVQNTRHGSQELCHNSDQCVCYVVVDRREDPNDTRQDYSNKNASRIVDSRALQDRHHFCQEEVADVGILNGVKNLQILSQTNFEIDDEQCTGNTVIFQDTHQPVKYLAFENDSKTKRVPIYAQDDDHVDSVDGVELMNSRMGHRAQESVQKIMVVPGYQFSRSNLVIEGCSHPRKVVLCQPEIRSNARRVTDPSKLCDIQVSKKNVIAARNGQGETIAYELQNAEDVKKSRRGGVNWEEVQYRPNCEHQVGDTCVQNQAIFYRK